MSSRICVDTGPLILHLRARNGRPSPLEQVRPQVDLVASAISVAEIWQGARPGEEAATQALVERCTVIPVDEVIARQAGTLAAQARAHGRALALPEGIIAATALTVGAPLWTTNDKDFLGLSGLELLPVD